MSLMKIPRTLSRAPAPGVARQRGAALYVALIMIVLLALIGIVGMQVAGMQEKMAAGYISANLAFQNAEADARLRECYLEGVVNRTGACAGGAPAGGIEQNCADGFDPTGWAAARSMTNPQVSQARVREIGTCISGDSSVAMGKAPVNENPNPVYQVTTYGISPSANANAAVDTIFRP